MLADLAKTSPLFAPRRLCHATLLHQFTRFTSPAPALRIGFRGRAFAAGRCFIFHGGLRERREVGSTIDPMPYTIRTERPVLFDEKNPVIRLSRFAFAYVAHVDSWLGFSGMLIAIRISTIFFLYLCRNNFYVVIL